MTNNIILPINSYSSFDFFGNLTFSKKFLQKELELYNQNKYNLENWDLLNIDDEQLLLENDIGLIINEIQDHGKIKEIDDDYEIQELIDDSLNEYKGKRDIKKIKQFLKDLNELDIDKIKELYISLEDEQYLTKIFYNDKKKNENLIYILSEYKSLYNSLINNQDLKALLINYNPKNIETIKDIIKNTFIELENQINEYNDVKDDLITSVILAQNGDKKAKDYIVGEIIFKEASNMAKKFSFRGGVFDEETYNDLLQEAILSSMNGLYKYDFKKNDNFIFYIRFWIKQGIHKGIETNHNEIKIPSHIIQLFSKIKGLVQQGGNIENELEDITLELIKEKENKIKDKIRLLKKDLNTLNGKEKKYIEKEIFKLTEQIQNKTNKEEYIKKIKNTIEKVATNSVVSIGSFFESLDDDFSGLEANVFVDESANIENILKERELSDNLKQMLDVILTDEEKYIIIHRYGLFGEDILLLDTLGKKLVKSTERVRQILKSALNKLSIRSFDDMSKNLSNEKNFLPNKYKG